MIPGRGQFWRFLTITFLNLIFDSVTYLCNQSEPFEQFGRGQPRDIHVEFGEIRINGSREEVVCSFPYIIQCKIVTPGSWSILTTKAWIEQF